MSKGKNRNNINKQHDNNYQNYDQLHHQQYRQQQPQQPQQPRLPHTVIPQPSEYDQQLNFNLNLNQQKHLNTSTPQHLNTSASQHLNTSTPQHLNTSTPQHLNISTNSCVGQPRKLCSVIHSYRITAAEWQLFVVDAEWMQWSFATLTDNRVLVFSLCLLVSPPVLEKLHPLHLCDAQCQSVASIDDRCSSSPSTRDGVMAYSLFVGL
eukprot:gene2199-5211_t